MLKRLLDRYEDFLRVDRSGATGSVVRLRSIYAFGWTFVFIQVANLISMTESFGGLARYHTISVAIILVVLISIHSLRYYKNYIVFTSFLFVMLLGGVAATAGPSGSGINTSLLSFIVITPIVCGFISGWRMTIVGATLSISLIWILYWVSTNAPGAGFETDPGRNLERAWQATYAVTLATVMGCAFAASIYHAFEKLERTATRLRKAEAAKARFLANMSHELRTPLNGVLGLTQSLQSTPLNDDQRHVLETIEKSGDSLLAILNDILDLSKIDAGRLEISEHIFNIRALIRDIRDSWIETARAKDLTLTVNVDKTLPASVIGDDVRIRQIITNLISNAIKFTDDGNVAINVGPETHDDGASIVVSVADTGPGISAENLKKLFQPFEQGDPDTTRKFGGTGLGLSICRNLAQLLGGDVTVRSEVGFGSTFTLRFPLKPAQEETPLKAENDPEKDVSLQGVCVLIVEDNHVNQMVVQRLLKGLGATFGTAENGQEAIDHLTKNKHRYDIILMDKQMPVMDGVEATRRLRSMDGDLASIPIIACTADVMTGTREQLLADGFTDFVEKPIRPGRLARAIAENIDRLGQEIPTDIPNTDDTYRVLAG